MVVSYYGYDFSLLFSLWNLVYIFNTLERHFTEHFYESGRERSIKIVCYSILNKNLDLHP